MKLSRVDERPQAVKLLSGDVKGFAKVVAQICPSGCCFLGLGFVSGCVGESNGLEKVRRAGVFEHPQFN